MMKYRNPTPQGFAITGAGFISIIVFFGLVGFKLISKDPIHWWLIVAMAVLVALISYIVLVQLLEKFIYRKIKLIYKNIHELKLGKLGFTEDKVKLNEDIISEVNDEVQKWALAKNKEIARLKEMEEYRKEFLGNVFHEIKTPVFSVQGYLHTLNDGALEDEEVNKDYVIKAVRNIDRLEQIIIDLELIALQENNKLELDVEDFDITAVIKDVFDGLELQADDRDIEFVLKSGCDKPFPVHGDKDKMRQVVVNLVSNAVKYGKEGGSVTVGIYDMAENILVEITDEGQGIPQENLPRLFERFYRVDKSRYRRGGIGGSGLGLAIVKHIVEAHDQTISVRSTVGVGSTFGFTIKKA